MGNRISTHIGIFQKLQTGNNLNLSQVTNELLSDYFGKTYTSSPYSVSYEESHLMTEISYCEKWSPRGIFNLIENNPDSIDKIFVRFLDEMSDNDLFFYLPNKINRKNVKTDSPKCIYLFDQLEFNQFDNQTELNNLLSNEYSNSFLININGKFEARTEIPFRLNNGINSLFEENSDRISNYHIENIQSKDKEKIDLIIKNSDCIRFKYKGITVHTIISTNLIRAQKNDSIKGKIWWAENKEFGKVNINSCGWQNCGNLEFIKYLASRRAQILELKNKSNT